MMPMRKKTFTAAVTVTEIIILLVGVQWVEVSNAESLDPNQPSVRLISPIPVRAYNSSSIELSLEITKPSSWCLYGWFYKQSSSSSGMPFDPRNLALGYGCIGRIDYLKCTLDSNTIQTFPVNDFAPFAYSDHPLSTKLLFSQSLSVPEGKHTLKIAVFGSYATDNYYPNGSRIYQIVNSSVETSFSVWYTSPKVSLESPQNISYSEGLVPIVLELDRSASFVYSLDGAGNASLDGNKTLTGLGGGSHSLVVYAVDSAGNMGKSDTVFFTIAAPILSPTLEPTLEPTIEPTPTATPTNGDNQTLDLIPILALSGIVVIAAAVGTLVYFRKRKRS